MKSIFHFFFFWLVHSSSFGQIDSLSADTIRQGNPNTNATFFDLANLLCNQDQQYVYNESKDTLFLPSLNLGSYCDCDAVEIVDTIQINGAGAKEIIFFRKCTGETNDQGGTFSASVKHRIQKYEIWDLDKKRMLFDVITYYDYEYEVFDTYQNPSYQKDKRRFKCTFGIDRNGIVTINNIRDKKGSTGKKKGKYVFVHDEFVRRK